MDAAYRQALREAILDSPAFPTIVSSLSEDKVTYNASGVWVDSKAPGFTGHTTSLTDEELVRAYLLLRLCTEFDYEPSPEVLRVETVYRPVGRPTGKGGRADVLVRLTPRATERIAFSLWSVKPPKHTTGTSS